MWGRCSVSNTDYESPAPNDGEATAHVVIQEFDDEDDIFLWYRLHLLHH